MVANELHKALDVTQPITLSARITRFVTNKSYGYLHLYMTCISRRKATMLKIKCQAFAKFYSAKQADNSLLPVHL